MNHNVGVLFYLSDLRVQFRIDAVATVEDSNSKMSLSIWESLSYVHYFCALPYTLTNTPTKDQKRKLATFSTTRPSFASYVSTRQV